VKPSPRRTLLIVLSFALLSLPAAAQTESVAPGEARLLSSVWLYLEALFPAIGESHAGMDPDGQPAREISAPLQDPDSHAGMDPDGKS
jgi:hypothetical protein